mmetsp:Transcript_32768/g.51120  ORF Transcript_32768/g.51120 Transcript_32768/m.51120 type:complete len:113 (+) Transcript_32768:180-518(+)
MRQDSSELPRLRRSGSAPKLIFNLIPVKMMIRLTTVLLILGFTYVVYQVMITHDTHSPVATFMMAGAAAMTAEIFSFPFDDLKERMSDPDPQATPSFVYSQVLCCRTPKPRI